VDTIEHPFRAPFNLAADFQFQLTESRPAGALAASDVDSWRAVNRLWKSGQPVWRDPASGDFFTQRQPNLAALKRPRIALYRSFMPMMDEGWTRWLLEDFGFEYRNIKNPEVEAGHLRSNYDVLVFPDQSAESISTGFRPGAMPEAYVGGLGVTAAANLKQFANDGGTLVFLNHSTEFALEALGIAVKNAVRGVPNRDFYSPGSLLNATLDTTSPLGYGVPKDIAIWSEGSPAWDAAEGNPGHIVARYPKDNVLASGWLLGPKYLENHAALLDVPMGKGRVILFGMRPQYRAQSYQTFKLFFNALALPAPM